MDSPLTEYSPGKPRIQRAEKYPASYRLWKGWISMSVNDAALNSVISEVSSVIASEVDSIYKLDYLEGTYALVKASEAVRRVFGEKGYYRQFISQIVTGRIRLRNSELYEGFLIDEDFIGKIYSQHVDIDAGNAVIKMLFMYFRVSSSKAYGLFYSLSSKIREEDRQLTKNNALNLSYLYSMMVDLDSNTCYDVYLSEISNPNQKHLVLTYENWRNNIIPCILSDQREAFKKNTEPDNIRARLSESHRFTFAVQLHSLSGQMLWTQHTLLRIQDNQNNHLLFMYTVQDIDEQIRPLHNHFTGIGHSPADESHKRTEISKSIFKTMQSLSSFSDMILDQIEIEIHENYNQKLSLKQLAAKYYINAAYLGQLFIQKHNMTFHDYLTDIRMEKAAELLRSSNYSIYQIAEMTGVPNSNYFHRLFRKRHNCTPLEYKYRVRSGEGADSPNDPAQTDLP